MGANVYLDIIFFALVAAFVIFRLSRTLGSRPDDSQIRRTQVDEGNNVISLRDGGRAEIEAPIGDEDAQLDPDVAPLAAAGLAEIRLQDPTFDTKQFLGGAKAAYETVVTAFAAGDLDTLGKLLTRDVLDNFTQAIEERKERGETLETTVVGIGSADVVDARMAGRTAEVTVKFVTELMNVIRDATGSLPAGKSDSVREVIDIWTFVRDARGSDPNWALAETRSPA